VVNDSSKERIDKFLEAFTFIVIQLPNLTALISPLFIFAKSPVFCPLSVVISSFPSQ
jgi:hypothetical protein